MKQFLGKWWSIGCLCLALVGVPLVLGACSLLTGTNTIYAANGSVQFPYPLVVSKGKCTAWSVVLDPGSGDPLCATSMPTQQVGQYIQLSYEGVQQSVCITAIDARQRLVHVQ